MSTIYVYNPETRGYDPVEFTEDVALSLHRQMWTDMKKNLGNVPTANSREEFKRDWCKKHIDGRVYNHCILCEHSGGDCDRCLIVWPNEINGKRDFYCCKIDGRDMNSYDRMPISRLLELPERSRDEQE